MRPALEHQIPLIDGSRYERADGPVAYDASDPRAAEPLVLLDTLGIAHRSYYARSDGGNPPYHRRIAGSREDTWLREGAAAALVAANRQLCRFGFELFVLDGHRSVECQQALFDFYFDRGRATLADPSDETCHRYASQFVSDTTGFSPTNHQTWPAHSTGGAVDVTLRSLETGDLVDMGSRFEEITPVSHNDHYERALLAGEIPEDDPRLWHRRLIHWAMEGAGWANSPWVFWHYDLGNELYIRMCRVLRATVPPAAWYGYIPPPDQR